MKHFFIVFFLAHSGLVYSQNKFTKSSCEKIGGTIVLKSIPSDEISFGAKLRSFLLGESRKEDETLCNCNGTYFDSLSIEAQKFCAKSIMDPLFDAGDIISGANTKTNDCHDQENNCKAGPEATSGRNVKSDFTKFTSGPLYSQTFSDDSYLSAGNLHGDPSSKLFQVCFGGGCKGSFNVGLGPWHIREIISQFGNVKTAKDEREAIERAIGLMEIFVGPAGIVDVGGNANDKGKTWFDCADEQVNGWNYLMVFKSLGLLKYHEVSRNKDEARQRRGITFIIGHWGTTITEKKTGVKWIVDSWFNDDGVSAHVVNRDYWLGKGGKGKFSPKSKSTDPELWQSLKDPKFEAYGAYKKSVSGGRFLCSGQLGFCKGAR